MSRRSREPTPRSPALRRWRSSQAYAALVEAKERTELLKTGLSKVREIYGDVFVGLDTHGIDFRLEPKQYLRQVVQQQRDRLPSLTDDALLKLWLRFAQYYGAQPHHQRTTRDWKFHAALGDEWDRRMLELPDGGDGFAWPSTSAADGDGSLGGIWPPRGMLDALGYTVGRTHGLPASERRRILDYLFRERLPVVVSCAYTKEWSKPETSARLQKLAVTLAALTRNAKRNRDRNYTQAIADWEEDLRYLHSAYYVGRFGFSWPSWQ